MKKFEDFENVDEKEKLFLELAHLDELDIKFDFIRYPIEIFYYYENHCLFNKIKTQNKFYINHNKIWIIFKNRYNLKYIDIKNFMKIMLDKHFNSKGYIPDLYNFRNYFQFLLG